MEKIAKHIETLLRRHDFVIVPDFGGFVTQFQSAEINDDQIQPPLAAVGFNPLMKASDGLLAIEISRAEDVSFREAVQLIESEVARIKHELSLKKTVSCGNLGALSLNEENKILFSPVKNYTFLPANYGLNTLFYSKTTQKAAEETQKTVTISLPARGKVARYAAVGIIALGLMFTAPKLNDMKTSTASFNPTSFVNIQPEKTNDVYEQPAEVAVENAVTAQEKTVEKTEEKKFHVIVGCLATQQKADNLIAHLKENNFSNASVVLPRIVTYRVAIDSFITEDEAVSYMRNLRETNPEFSDAWVLNY